MRRRRRREDDTSIGDDIVEDLEDQARWSGYTQHIPRVGDARRQRIWLRRWYRLTSSGALWLGLAIAAVVVTGVSIVLWLLSLLW